MIRFFLKVLERLINNIGIRKKIYLSFVIFFIIPISITGLMNYENSSHRLQNQFEFSIEKTFKQTFSYLEFKMKNINDTMNFIIIDSETQKFLKYKKTNDYNSINTELYNYKNMESFLMSFERSGNIYRLSMYILPGPFYTDNDTRFHSLLSFQKNTLYTQLNTYSNSSIWISDTSILDTEKFLKPTFAVFKKIVDLDHPLDIIGVCRIEVLKSDLESIVTQTLATPKSAAMILDSSGKAIVKVGKPVSKDNNILLEQIPGLADENGTNLNIHSISIEDKGYVAMIRSIPYSDWQLVLLIPSDDILSVTKQSRNESLAMIAALGILSYIFIIFISKTITNRIHMLINCMKNAEHGDLLKTSILNSSKDEIGELNRNYNILLARLSLLVEEKSKMVREMKNSELKALQAQINPHFLYNTLDLIRWMAIESKTSEIISLVLSLAKFYKLSLSSGEEIITLQNELEHVKTYVEIQNKRFGNSIHLDCNVTEDLLKFKIIKLIMQPLVENAIMHGIHEKTEEYGTIKIEGELNEKDLMIYITDDGVGMTKDQVENIMQSTASQHLNGYGVKNIQQRLKLYYGPEYGLTYVSEPGAGTTVCIIIPVFKADDGMTDAIGC